MVQFIFLTNTYALYKSVFLNRWAEDNFRWASNLVVLLSFTEKLKLYYNTALGFIKYVKLKEKRTYKCL